MVSGKAIHLPAFGNGPSPHDFVSKACDAKDIVEHYLEVVARMWIAVKIERPGLFQDSMKLSCTFAHPLNIVTYTALPSVLKRPHFGLISPYNFVNTIREERRIQIDKVYALTGHTGQTCQVVFTVERLSF